MSEVTVDPLIRIREALSRLIRERREAIEALTAGMPWSTARGYLAQVERDEKVIALLESLKLAGPTDVVLSAEEAAEIRGTMEAWAVFGDKMIVGRIRESLVRLGGPA